MSGNPDEVSENSEAFSKQRGLQPEQASEVLHSSVRRRRLEEIRGRFRG
jgi:hypothetical protein